MIKAVIPYMVLVMWTAHVYSANILSRPHLKMKKKASSVPKLINGKVACPPRPERGAVEKRW